MLRDDGMLVSEQGFFERLHVMYLVWYCRKSPELKRLNLAWSWSKFLTIGMQFVFCGQFRAISEAEMKELNHV